jgi:glycosyltransferase involved in cell wall biosynthesis
MNKVKLLIVSWSLMQAGSERWVYEICRSIDKDRFEVGLLTARPPGNAEDDLFWTTYPKKLRDLDIPIFPFISVDERSTAERLWDKGQRVIRGLFGKDAGYVNPRIVDLFRQYDAICVIDFYNYIFVRNELHTICPKSFFVVLHCHLVQFDTPIYDSFDRNKTYDFTYFCPKQIEEVAEGGHDKARNRFFYSPLVMDLSSTPNLYNPPQDEVLFAIFTRVAPTKPIDAFIESFYEIKMNCHRQVKLLIYGEVVDQLYFEKLWNKMSGFGLGENDIVFKGHAPNMAAAIAQDRVNIYWGLSINTSVGYASIEVGAMGIPSIYWNLDTNTGSDYVSEATSGTLISHNVIGDFVKTNLALISDDETLAALSLRQRAYFLRESDISQRIGAFEDYVISIAGRNR